MKIIIIKESNGIYPQITSNYENCEKDDQDFIEDIAKLINDYNQKYLSNA